MKPRVMFVADTSRLSGPTTSLLLLLDGLRERVDPIVVAPGKGELIRAVQSRGIQVVSLPGIRLRHLRLVYGEIKNSGSDLVYANTAGGASRNAFIAARLAGRPFVCHVRGMSTRRGRRKLFFLRCADAVVAVSKAAARAVEPFAGSTPIHVVYNGVDVPKPSRDRGSARRVLLEELSVPEDSFIILQAAHVCPRKGQLYAVRALYLIRRTMPHAALLMAGALDRDEAYVEELRHLVSSLALEDGVRLLGLRTDLPELLSVADLFLHTAIRDPHPRAVLEAMAAGLPVVAFEVDGVAETVVDGSTGRLVPAGDVTALASATTDLLARPSEAARLGGEGRRRVQEYFRASETANGVGRVIESVLERRVGEIRG